VRVVVDAVGGADVLAIEAMNERTQIFRSVLAVNRNLVR
jgi:hypothetical protein